MKIKKLPVAMQAGMLKHMFPGSAVSTSADHGLTWIHSIRPSSLGELYKVKLTYTIGSEPNCYIVTPSPLILAEGATKLPHMYEQKRQKLCLYYPDGKEWNASMSIAQTIIPWIYDWLYHYEIWRSNGGVWTGGGVHVARSSKK